ncbi:MAG: adenosylcobinamide-phosphate synthase CbiB [Coriobacteriia bacterium]|nr:adenosylcobinamide-phosphate synthase CbiB [Coriobacteriia bacterium]
MAENRAAKFTCVIEAILLDALIGDPKELYHPVQAIGRLIGRFEDKLLHEEDSDFQKFLAGLATFTFVSLSSASAAQLLSKNKYLALYLMQAGLSERALLDAGSSLRKALKVSREHADLNYARKELSKYVGRDTSKLNISEIAKAGVETIAENTNDGFVAPLYWLCVGHVFGMGPFFLWFYKAASTLDSTIGYRSARYEYFGKVSARVDDVFAWLPARIAGLSVVLASVVLRYNAQAALLCIKKEGSHHESPNAGVLEAAFAGALELELGGPARYKDRLVAHPYINKGASSARPHDIKRAQTLSAVSAVISSALIIGSCMVLKKILSKKELL